MQTALKVRTRLLTAILSGVAALGFAAAATAEETGADASADARLGGAADAHMSPSGHSHNNAQWQNDAARGADRAAERMGDGLDEIDPAAPAERKDAARAAQATRPGMR
jgi:hypothetical protein